jgi:hypothetical protein
MSISNDIKETLEEVGTQYSVKQGTTTLAASEYLDYDLQTTTNPFLRNFFLDATLPFDTTASVGNVLTFSTTGDKYLLMNKQAELFENSVLDYQTVLYKCNVSGELLRPSGEDSWSDQSYHKETQFGAPYATGVNCLMVEPIVGNDLDIQQELATLNIFKDQVYIPHHYGVQLFDRFAPFSGEYYRIEGIITRQFAGVDVCKIGEDTR